MILYITIRICIYVYLLGVIVYQYMFIYIHHYISYTWNLQTRGNSLSLCIYICGFCQHAFGLSMHVHNLRHAHSIVPSISGASDAAAKLPRSLQYLLAQGPRFAGKGRVTRWCHLGGEFDWLRPIFGDFGYNISWFHTIGISLWKSWGRDRLGFLLPVGLVTPVT